MEKDYGAEHAVFKKSFPGKNLLSDFLTQAHLFLNDTRSGIPYTQILALAFMHEAFIAKGVTSLGQEKTVQPYPDIIYNMFNSMDLGPVPDRQSWRNFITPFIEALPEATCLTETPQPIAAE